MGIKRSYIDLPVQKERAPFACFSRKVCRGIPDKNLLG